MSGEAHPRRTKIRSINKHPLEMMKLLLMTLMMGSAALQAGSIEADQAVDIVVQGVPPSEGARLNGKYPVSGSGYIHMWEVGQIKAAGVDTSTLARRIEAAYKNAEIYTNPTFQVFSSSADVLKQQMVTVGGKVNSPGPKPYRKGMTLFQAVTAAGGPTAFGAKNRVRLYRNNRVSTYDMNQAKHKQLLLDPNDTVEVPEKNWFGR